MNTRKKICQLLQRACRYMGRWHLAVQWAAQRYLRHLHMSYCNLLTRQSSFSKLQADPQTLQLSFGCHCCSSPHWPWSAINQTQCMCVMNAQGMTSINLKSHVCCPHLRLVQAFRNIEHKLPHAKAEDWAQAWWFMTNCAHGNKPNSSSMLEVMVFLFTW